MAFINHMGGPSLGLSDTCDICRSVRTWNHTALRAYCGPEQYCFRRLLSETRQVKLDVASSTFQLHRYMYYVRYQHSRSFCKLSKFSNQSVQQSVLGPNLRGHRCVSTNWTTENNYVNAPFGLILQVLETCQNSQDFCRHYCAVMEK